MSVNFPAIANPSRVAELEAAIKIHRDGTEVSEATNFDHALWNLVL